MAMVPVKCTSCGGEIQLDDQKESGFCLHCGTKVVFRDAISKVTIDQSYLIDIYLILANTAYLYCATLIFLDVLYKKSVAPA